VKTFSFIFINFLLFVQPYFSQEIKVCKEKTFWVFKEDKKNYAVKLDGTVTRTNTLAIVGVNSYTLQSLIVDKAGIAKVEDTTDLKVLTRYAVSETEKFSATYKKKLGLNAKKTILESGKTILVWHYEMPAGYNKEVKCQVFVNMVIDDKIFGLSCPQFKDQKLKDIKEFLTTTIGTLKEYRKVKDVCKE